VLGNVRRIPNRLKLGERSFGVNQPKENHLCLKLVDQ
jgi:hypothetical protein